ncbi:MAG TPA: SDR family NAD(P)-dependent oxidoreductase [Stellaceae bacterium]|jgi:NAD(P)-dependent dehydrogenase (short-subunit alcohol dehydrogenase family)
MEVAIVTGAGRGIGRATALELARMSINAKAVFFASRAVLPAMIAQRRGTIVNVASMAGKIGSRNNLPYTPAKPRSSA